MAAQQGVCQNYGYCQFADEKKPLFLDITNGICPVCGQPLIEIPGPYLQWLKISLILLILIVGGGVWWYFSPQVPILAPKQHNPELARTEKLRKQIESLQAPIDAIQAEIGKTPVVSLISKLEEVQGQVGELHGKIDHIPELQTQLDERQTQIEQIYTQMVENIAQEINRLQSKIGTTNTHIVSELEPVQKQIKAIQNATAQLPKINRQIEKVQTQIEQIFYTQLVENIAQEINRIQSKIGTTNTHIVSELESVQKQIKGIQNATANLPKSSQLVTLNRQIERVQTQIEQIYIQMVENLTQKINHFQSQVGTNIITELESVQKQINAIATAQLPETSQFVALQRQIEELQAQIKAIYHQLVKEIQSQLEKIQAQVVQVDLATKLEKLQRDVWGIQRPIARFYGTKSLLYAQVGKLQTGIEQIYAQRVDQINQKMAQISKQPIRGTSAVISLTTQLEEIQEPIDAVYKLLDKLYESEQVSALQKQLEKQQTGIEQTYRKLVVDIEKQIEAMPADKCAAQKSLHPEIETLKTQIEAIQQRIGKSIRRPEMAALKTRLDWLHRKSMRDLTEISSCSCVDEVPKCLSAEMRRKLPLSCVPTMRNRSIPDYLHDWIKGVTKITETEFFVMRREVKVGEFQDYVKTLNKEQKEQLGMVWRQNDAGKIPDDNPVAGVPWWAAKAYADWLSKKTGCQLTLPTYNQWVAATISHANPETAVIRDKQQFLGLKPQQRTDEGGIQASGNLFQQLLNEDTKESSGGVLDLLGNLREWSIDNRGQQQCPDDNYHYILGEDYKTWRNNIAGAPICEMGISDMVGFRLVLREKK